MKPVPAAIKFDEDLGIYIQVPFCASKCTFCNFSSSVERSGIFDRYTQAIIHEIATLAENYTRRGIPTDTLTRPVTSLYFGGGTPALLGVHRLRQIVNALRTTFSLAVNVEFTFETTPGSASLEMLGGLREIGVNRLSIGAQTFEERELAALGRLHSVDDTRTLVRDAQRAGIESVGLDLIAGLPHQTATSFDATVESAIELAPGHLSLYLFEIDDKSRLGKELIEGGHRYSAGDVPDEEFVASAYERACAKIQSAGYIHYEISNFSLAGHESCHNRKYWQLAPYIGLGAGAHSFDGRSRWSNYVDVYKYVAAIEASANPIDQLHALAEHELIEEFFFLGLRQTEGIDLRKARSMWGATSLKPWEAKIGALRDDGLLAMDGDCVRLETKAYLVSNEIFQQFVSV